MPRDDLEERFGGAGRLTATLLVTVWLAAACVLERIRDMLEAPLLHDGSS